MKRLFFVFCLIQTSMLFGQETYEWGDGICRHYGTIIDSLTNKEQLDNARSLLGNPSPLSRPALLNKPSDSTRVRYDLVEKECNAYIKELKTAEFPKGVFWDSVANLRITELERECALKKLAIVAIKNPGELSKDKETAKSCKKWIKILQSSDETKVKEYKTWLGVEEYNKLAARGLTTKQLAQLATIDFMRFEWWNCANATIPSLYDHTEFEKQFLLLLEGVNTECR